MKVLSFLIFTTMLVFLTISPVQAESLVIVTARDNVEELSTHDVARIFLGKVTSYPSGAEVVPLNMDPEDQNYAEFARIVLKKTTSQLKAYWAKQVFTGKGRPPRSLGSSAKLRELVASHKRYLSYLDRNDIDNSVRWVIELRE